MDNSLWLLVAESTNSYIYAIFDAESSQPKALKIIYHDSLKKCRNKFSEIDRCLHIYECDLLINEF